MSSPAISVQNLAKTYRIWESPAARLVSPLLGAAADVLPAALPAAGWLRSQAGRRYRDFQALKGLSFTLNRGEAVGIVGRNGSGKSTLLQIIAGTLQPSDGTALVNGRVAALLELGAGFNPEFTGRENVFLNGAVLGLSPAVLAERYDSIAAYADIGEFLDQPVRTYSTGMQMRLAFAVAAHVDAEILIIDEALGVGDARFQLKCAQTIDEFIASGKTLLFVSHDLGSVKRLCSRALLLEQGELVMDAAPNPIINFYSKLLAAPQQLAALKAEALTLQQTGAARPATSTAPTASTAAGNVIDDPLRRELAEAQRTIARLAATGPQAHRLTLLEKDGRLEPDNARGAEFAYGGESGRITSLQVRNNRHEDTLVFTTGEDMHVRFHAEAIAAVAAPLYALTVKSANGQDVYCTNTMYVNADVPALAAGGQHVVSVDLSLNLMPGEYFLSVGWVTFHGEELQVIHRRYDAVKFTVLPVDRRIGIANLHSKITVTPLA